MDGTGDRLLGKDDALCLQGRRSLDVRQNDSMRVHEAVEYDRHKAGRAEAMAERPFVRIQNRRGDE